MKYTVLLSAFVERELEEAALFLEEKRKGYGVLFINDFDKAVSYLSLNPQAFAIKFKSYREIRIGRFSYLLIYKVTGQTVFIAKLIHTSRNQKKRYLK